MLFSFSVDSTDLRHLFLVQLLDQLEALLVLMLLLHDSRLLEGFMLRFGQLLLQRIDLLFVLG